MDSDRFDQVFKNVFNDSTLADLKFFVKRRNEVTADKIKEELMKFEDSIKSNNTSRVHGVD